MFSSCLPCVRFPRQMRLKQRDTSETSAPVDDLGFVDGVTRVVARGPIRATFGVGGLRSSCFIGSLWASSCFTTSAIMRRYASTVAGDGPPHRLLAAADPLSRRFVENDSRDLVVTGRACCVWSLRLALSSCMSFLVCGSFVSDLHLVPFFEIFGVPRYVTSQPACRAMALVLQNRDDVQKNSGLNALGSRWLPAA